MLVDSGLECDSLVKQVYGGGSSGLAGLYLKSTCPDELFITSRNWLTLGEAVSPKPARSRDVKASQERKRKP